jgi:hypothetical protein
MNIQMSIQHNITNNNILLSELTTRGISFTVTVLTDDEEYFIMPNPVPNKTVKILQYDSINEGVVIGTGVTNSNGITTINITGLLDTPDEEIELEILAISDTLYNSSAQSVFITVENDVRVNPLSDELLFNISNWGTYPSANSSSAQSGTLTPATTSDLTINSTAKTITDSNTKYFVYNKSLQDFLDYGDEINFIVYKTGGDGKYQLGFINTTNGKKLGYIDGAATNQVDNASTNLGEVTYQKYNQITFVREGTNLTIYWKNKSSVFVQRTLSLANVDPTRYYFYWRSTVRKGLTLTNDETKIQEYSKQQ